METENRGVQVLKVEELENVVGGIKPYATEGTGNSESNKGVKKAFYGSSAEKCSDAKIKKSALKGLSEKHKVP